jgi:hypothetical protein
MAERKFDTAAKVSAWIMANRPPDPADGRDTMTQALWWFAYEQEEQISYMNRRERMEMLVEGLPALTEQNLTDSLTQEYEDAPFANGDDESVNQEIEDRLCTFWIPEKGK